MSIRATIAFTLLGATAQAQLPVLEWGHLFSGPGNLSNYINTCDAVTTDPDGNVYTVGAFANNLDLIPGSGSFLVASTGQTDFDLFLAKYDSVGQFIWGRQLSTGSITYASWIGRQPGGDLVIAGYHNGTTDFDPGPGAVSLTGNGDLFFARYTANGDLIWAKVFGSLSGVDEMHAMAVDPLGNIWIAGSINGDIDLDPGPGQAIYPCTPASRDGFLVKYDPNGALLWGHTFGNTWGDDAKAIAFTPSGNTVLTGRFRTSMDAEPGPGTTTLNEVGSSEDVFVITYSPTGQVLGSFVFGGSASSQEPMAIAVDGTGAIYVLGEQYGSAGSFTPGQATGTINPGSNMWGWLVKYSASGTLLWYDLFTMSGSNGPGMMRLALDSEGAPHIIGASTTNFDADPGPSMVPMASGHILKYDPADGALVWAVNTGSGSGQYLRGLCITPGDDVLVAGGGNANWAFNGQLMGSGNVAVLLRTGECLPPQITTEPTVISDYCAPATELLAVEAQGTLLQYQWSMNGVPMGTGTDTLQVGPLPAGTYAFTCVISGLCGADTTMEVVMAVAPTPEPIIIDFAGTLTCTNATGSYQWLLNGAAITGANSSTWVPQANGNYTVLVNDGQCIGLSGPFYFGGIGITERPLPAGWLESIPGGDRFTVIGAASGTEIQLFDMSGLCVARWRSEGERTTCSIQALATGVYIVRSAGRSARVLR
ncbi:MAG TPA: hypothetical protein PLB89_11075 [Flavobacteriales bacterium]|nr:hypothetical protein [Flavobacteriales bacterium]